MRRILMILGCSLLQGTGEVPKGGGVRPAEVEAAQDLAWVRSRMEAIRRRHDLPDLGAVVVIQGKVVMTQALGVRKYGTEIAVRPEDPFHLGSITKVMTATLAGRMVDRGVLRWEMTMEEMFPELAKKMHPGYRRVTVSQLLSHTGGFPYGPSRPMDEITASEPNAVKRRYAYVEAAIADPPQAAPGEKVIYSGGGIVVVSYLERKLKTSYEELMKKEVFEPLGMKTAGLGDHMAKGSGVNAPWGHRQSGGKTLAIEPDPRAPSNGREPVGGASVSMEDLGRFLALHLDGARGRARLLKPETFQKLHAADPGGSFAPGWSTEQPDWARGKVLAHSGSIGIHVAICWVVPEEGYAIGVGTNAAGEPRADEALGELFQVLLVGLHRGSGMRPLPPKPEVWLDREEPLAAAVGYGKFQPGKTVSGGVPVVGGAAVEHALGVHAPAELVYRVPEQASGFVGRFCVQDSLRASASAEVYLDGVKLDVSPVLKAGDPPWNFTLPFPHRNPGDPPRVLKLVVTDGGDGIHSDWANWIDAGFVTGRR